MIKYDLIIKITRDHGIPVSEEVDRLLYIACMAWSVNSLGMAIRADDLLNRAAMELIDDHVVLSDTIQELRILFYEYQQLLYLRGISLTLLNNN
jgi:hypothetical protein